MDRNVIVICLDTVRKDYFDTYCSSLSTLSDTSFNECRSASSWSVPSHASMLTGELPHKHGVHTYSPDFSRLAFEDTFLADLPNHRLIGVSANSYASPVFGFDDFFDHFSFVSRSNRYPEALDPSEFFHQSSGPSGNVAYLRQALSHEKSVRSILNGVFQKLDGLIDKTPIPKPYDDGCSAVLCETTSRARESEEPFFAFVNLMDVHGPLRKIWQYDQTLQDVPNTFDSRDLNVLKINMDEKFDEYETDLEYYRKLYAAAIEYLDRQVSEFVARIQDICERELTVVITSDHGEQLVEQDIDRRFGHITPDLTEQLLHVPLEVINTPDDTAAETNELFSHLTLGELVTSYARGRDLRPSSKSVAAEVVGIGVSNIPYDHDQFEQWDRTVRCVYDDGIKYVWNSNGEIDCFRVRDCPASSEMETTCRDLSGIRNRAPFSKPINEFAESVRSDPRTISIDNGTRNRLADLGYL